MNNTFNNISYTEIYISILLYFVGIYWLIITITATYHDTVTTSHLFYIKNTTFTSYLIATEVPVYVFIVFSIGNMFSGITTCCYMDFHYKNDRIFYYTAFTEIIIFITLVIYAILYMSIMVIVFTILSHGLFLTSITTRLRVKHSSRQKLDCGSPLIDT